MFIKHPWMFILNDIFFHSRTVSGVFLPNFISSFLIKGEGSSKMSSQRQLLGPLRLFGRPEFLGHIQ